ncbi:DivIVA domain-containing protein [Microlunatus elymi]|uniref:Cell wall synthesis protein Wag31 n=1 Tax=Microlunatus elymi TaxID=2596828 RepID=A0A516Q2D1_9ACTN|nr:DivIVA domain-containing protein [Microlunatus elymi]QDP97583.1 DivIVA domain-containing protein [Microlunatus elymi]
MSLTLDEVRNIKFRMAKRSGYEVLDVDEFVDQVEASFEQLLEENANLKRQVESLKVTADTADGDTGKQPAVRVADQQPTATAESSNGERIVVTTSSEASAAVVRLVQMSTEQAENLVTEAEQEAGRIKSDAERTAKQLTTDASTRAERVESEARVNAERIRTDAQTRADRLDRDTEDKRRELFGELEKQRDQLAGAVAELRTFESDFRRNLTSELRSHIDKLSGGKSEPGSAPKILDEVQPKSEPAKATEQDAEPSVPQSQATPSDTPRLDALLGDQR